MWDAHFFSAMNRLLQSVRKGRSTAVMNETPAGGGNSESPFDEFSEVALPVVFPERPRNSTLSPKYSNNVNESYIKQCFDGVRYLAQGSFGVVFEARSKDDGKLYAIKQFKKPFRNQRHRIIRLEEVHRYASIPQSRFCVKLIRAWEEKAFLFVQMELCSTTLKQYIMREGLTEKLMWRVLVDLLLALKHLHKNALIHLDIKPENILVSDDGTFKLADFGLMLDLSKGKVDDAEEGDSRYLAPEVLQGVYSEAADIFSLGIMMLEMACSIQLPSHGSLWQELRHGVLPYCKFACTSRDLFYIICEMMAPLPADRPTASKILKYNRLSRLRSMRRVRSFISDVTSTMKSICHYGRDIAVLCGTKIIDPLVSCICPRVVKRKAEVWPEDDTQSDQLNYPEVPFAQCEGPPPLDRSRPARTREEEREFRVLLDGVKKRLTFEDEGPVLSPGPSARAAELVVTERPQLAPKRRRLFE